MQQRGVIHSTFCMFLGKKKHGKSGAMKIIASRLMLMAAGDDQMRVTINDYKPEGKDSEYAAFSAYHNSKVFRIADMSVNPFEAKLYQFGGSGANLQTHELGMLGTAESICEFAKGSRLSGKEHTALRIALAAMLEYNEAFWSLQLLAKLLRSIEKRHVDAYFGRLDAKLHAQLKNRADSLTDPLVRDTAIEDVMHVVEAPNNLSVEELQSAGSGTATYLDRVLFGSYGNMFGTKHSLYDMLTQRTVTKDWRGVTEEAEQIMRILMTRIKISAIERNTLALLPHIDIDDEQHRSMGSLVYARSHSHLSEIGRGVHTFSMTATHGLNSIRRGDTGSELYNLGNTIIGNVGMVFIGRQVNSPTVLDELRQLYQLTGVQTESLTTLPRQTFLVKAGDEEARYVQITAAPDDMLYLPSDSASKRMTAPVDHTDQESLRRYAQANGIKLRTSDRKEDDETQGLVRMGG